MYTKRITIFLVLFLFWRIEARTGWFWHVTDFHWDFSYWTDQLSCNGVGPKQPGVFGDEWCDAPWRLIQETVADMKRIKQDVDFVLWTGDSAPHVNPSHLSTEGNLDQVRNITSLFNTNFPAAPLCATFGNNDYYKAHQFPPYGNEMYNATYEMWKDHLYNETTFLKGGYYTVKPSESLRIVALNTNLYYYKDNETMGVSDPADQFVWLENVLKYATEHREKVFVMSHIPPGYNTPRAIRWMTSDFNDRFIDIIRRQSDVIAAMHFGHEHHDNFRLLYDASGRPLASIFIAPSVTPWRYRLEDEISPAHNPGVRLVKFDTVTGKQLDIVQYYVDLQQVNNDGVFVLKHGYNATQLYGIPDLAADSLHGLVKRMEGSNGPEFKAFINWYNTNATNDGFCDEACHNTIMCGFRFLDKDSFDRCLNPTANDSIDVVGKSTFVLFQMCLILLFMVV